MLSLRQVEDVCLLDGEATQCRFLAEEDNGSFYCLKHTLLQSKIDSEVAAWKQIQKSGGVDPNQGEKPIGDNCAGYVLLRHKKQGYDIP